MPRIDALVSWNMGFKSLRADDGETKQRRLDLLRTLVDARRVVLLALQETPTRYDLQRTLGSNFGVEVTTGGVAIAYHQGLWSADFRDDSNPRIASVGLRPLGASASIWMLSVHGPALHVNEHDKQEFVRGVGGTLRKLRANDGSRLNIVAGDLNVPPFDHAVTRKEGLYANRALRWVRNQAPGVDSPLFNPTWTILGRCEDVPGTFYRSGSVDADGPWHGFDQVMLSADFVGAGFDIAVVDSVAGASLRSGGPIGAPDTTVGSDHLPIAASLAVV